MGVQHGQLPFNGYFYGTDGILRNLDHLMPSEYVNFDVIQNRPNYDGSPMTHETDIPFIHVGFY